MSYLSLHKAKILLSSLSILAGLGFNISLHEVGKHWHYPVLSLLFTSALSVFIIGATYLLIKGSAKQSHTKKPRTSVSYKTVPIATPETNSIQISTWRWEFPADGTPTNDTQNAASSIASTPATPSQSIRISPSTSTNKLNLTVWAKHKHFIVCGFLLAGVGICAVFTAPLVSYQWQIFAFQFTLPVTYFLHDHVISKSGSRQRQVGLIIVAFGGFLNGIPAVLDSNFSGWCGMFAAAAIFSGVVSVHIGYLCSMDFDPVEIAVWSNVYLFFFILLVSPMYAFSGLQKQVHSFSELFWYQKQGITCLTSGADPCHPHAWIYALSFVALFAIYFMLQAMLAKAEDASIQVGINSLALPLMTMVYQIEQSANAKLLYPIVAVIVIVVGIFICKQQALARDYSALKPYRF